jgi:hypothetical protein
MRIRPISPGDPRAGLRLDVAAPPRPGLRVEVTAGRRLSIRQGDRVVLLARQRARHRGVHYGRTGGYASPLPPITADRARRLAAADEDAWAHHFAARLRETATGPLHEGRWNLVPGMPRWTVPTHWDRLIDVDPDVGHVTWAGFGDPVEDFRDILPLRRLSPAGAARVRSYRRQHREGVLPPVLLWWVSGMATLLLLDGHDRLVAALAEGARPDVLVLAPAVRDDRSSAFLRDHHIREYDHRVAAMASDPLAPLRLGVLGARLAAELHDTDRREGATRAWPLRGGRPVWDAMATALAPGRPLLGDD